MPLIIERNDLTKINVDAVVIPTNPWLEEAPGINSKIHNAAGAERIEEQCAKIGYIDYGKVVMTDGFALPSRYIIHAVVPLWADNDRKVRELLSSCYKEALSQASRSGLVSVAFPILVSGRSRYPMDKMLDIAIGAIEEFITEDKPSFDAGNIVGSLSTDPSDMTIHLLLEERFPIADSMKYLPDLIKYIEREYEAPKIDDIMESIEFVSPKQALEHQLNRTIKLSNTSMFDSPISFDSIGKSGTKSVSDEELEELFRHQTETFTDALHRLVSESGKSEKEVYNGANISKFDFEEITTNRMYKPKKTTILALAVGMNLNLKETDYLLMKAGYALSVSSKRDIIFSYFIERKLFAVHQINTALFAFGEKLLCNEV